jgi:Icc-related predicted phosphoesterase
LEHVIRILAISDDVVPQIYHAGIKSRFPDVDLVLGCGDLPHYYLEYVVTMLNVPLFYVMGNHHCELEHTPTSGQAKRPGGCLDIDERSVEFRGLLIAGLEGSMRYKAGPSQYTQREMSHKALRLSMQLLRNRVLKGRWLDILVTHAPPFGIHDGKDLCHTGFHAFLKLMERYKPRYLIHGHSHVYNQLQQTETQHHRTTVLNVHPYRLLDVAVPAERARAGLK